jgi:hypothetical protein
MYSKEGDEQWAGVCVHYLRYYVHLAFKNSSFRPIRHSFQFGIGYFGIRDFGI